MATSIILISLDSLEDSVGTSAARVILFGTIPTAILSTAPTTDLPVIHDDTSLIPNDTPTISPTVPIPPIAPTVQYTFPFIDTDLFDSDTPERPPSTRTSRSLLVDLTVPSLMGVLKMLTARKSVGSLPTHRLASRYPSDSSSSNYFTSDDSSRDSLSDSLLETSSDSYPDTTSDSSLRHSPSGYALSDSLCDSPTATSAEPSRERCRSPTVSPYVASPIREALSLVRADLLPPRKRIKDSDSMTDLEANIDACAAFADDIRARGTDVRVVVETVAEEEVESSTRGTVEVEVDLRVRPINDDDVRESVREDVPDHVTTNGAVEVTYKTLGDLGHRIVATSQQSATMSERIGMLERDNVRLRGILDVERQRVDHLLRSITMLTATRFRMTQDAIIKLVAKRVEEALRAYDAAKNLKTKTRIEDDQHDDHVKADVNNGSGNENGNGNPNVNNEGVVPALMKLMMRSQELTLLCTKMVLKEEDKVKKYIGGLSNNIQGNVIAVEPTRLHDAMRVINNLMDQKLKGYATKNAENKRRFNNNSRDNHGQQQQPFKRQNVNGPNIVIRTFATDCRTIVAATPQRPPIRNQTRNDCYECGRQGHYRNECPKLRNQNRRNKIGNKTRNNEAKARAYAIGGGGANPDSDLVTDMFLFNNRYAAMLFDLGADRSFVSTTFSALLDVIPSTLDTRLLGCMFDIDLMPVEIGSFDVIVGMDWLAKYNAVIIYDEKIFHIPYGDEVLIIQGDGCNGRSKSKLSILSCTKTQKYIHKGGQVYLDQVMVKKTDDKWLKYVTQVHLAKSLTVYTFDDLFHYLQQFEKLANTSREKKLEKSHDPLPLVAHTGSSSRNTSSYYVTHPTSVVDYDDKYQQDDIQTNSEDPLTSAILLLAQAIT
nr:hypothetical protein [Tanacetum cinerariifolium]